MWLQKGNSQRWSIWQEGETYHCFTWDCYLPERDAGNPAYYMTYLSTSKLAGDLGNQFPEGRHEAWRRLPERGFMSKGEKDQLWKRIHCDPATFVVVALVALRL